MAMDICIQGIGELKESKELKLMHIRLHVCRSVRQQGRMFHEDQRVCKR